MTVYVVMGNAYPDVVFITQALAEAYCELKRRTKYPPTQRSWIHWTFYEFELREKLE